MIPINSTVLWITVPLMLGGLLAWNVAATICKAWLKAHEQLAPTVLDSFWIGTLFSSIKPVRRYAAARRKRGENTTLATVFWGGLAISWGGFACFILLHLVLGSH